MIRKWITFVVACLVAADIRRGIAMPYHVKGLSRDDGSPVRRCLIAWDGPWRRSYGIYRLKAKEAARTCKTPLQLQSWVYSFCWARAVARIHRTSGMIFCTLVLAATPMP